MTIDENKRTQYFTNNLGSLDGRPFIRNESVESLVDIKGSVKDLIDEQYSIQTIGDLTDEIARTRGVHLVKATITNSDKFGLLQVFEVKNASNFSISHVNILTDRQNVYVRHIKKNGDSYNMGAWNQLT